MCILQLHKHDLTSLFSEWPNAEHELKAKQGFQNFTEHRLWFQYIGDCKEWFENT